MAMDQAHDEAQMGFLDHLEELRRRLFIAVVAVLGSAVVLFVKKDWVFDAILFGPRNPCLLYTSPSPRDRSLSRMPSSA